MQADIMSVQPKIGDYGAIGDGRSVGLVSREGSLDWLCWPRFDSPSLFARLLDTDNGGYWQIAPEGSFRVSRRYIENTNVLETRFATGAGEAVLTDLMPVVTPTGAIRPEQELLRRLECISGSVRLRATFEPRPGFATGTPRLSDRGRFGVFFQSGPCVFNLRSEAPLKIDESGGAHSELLLVAGQAVNFSLTLAREGPLVFPPLGDRARDRSEATARFWQQWAGRCRYDGPFRELVVRSALALKLLFYAPSGAIIAAPTTSLPERLGGDLNWDYRFCWLRDAAFTARALFGLDYREEAEAFVSWLLHATRLTLPELRVLYDVYGQRQGKEEVLSHLRGYADSRPVRAGNHAGTQFQLDVYGEVVEAVSHFVEHGGELDRDTQKMLRHVGEYVCRHWHKPDSGIWEERTPGEHYTYSRLMCFVALDRLLALNARNPIRGIPAEKFATERSKIRKDIEDRGWNPRLQSYTQVLDGATLDASVLLMAAHGFEAASSRRMRATHSKIRERLSPAPGLLYRKEQSLTMGEGAFGICSFWEVDFLARGGGSSEEAHDALARAAAYANDLGLFAEEIDSQSSDALGNFPQGFTHVGLINAALSMTERQESHRQNGESKSDTLELNGAQLAMEVRQ
jgi:GH15 family glucan-1,4-alpha-glucosidase